MRNQKFEMSGEMTAAVEAAGAERDADFIELCRLEAERLGMRKLMGDIAIAERQGAREIGRKRRALDRRFSGADRFLMAVLPWAAFACAASLSLCAWAYTRPAEAQAAVAETNASAAATADTEDIAPVKGVEVPEFGKDGKPSEWQVRTVRAICAAGWSDLYSGKMAELDVTKDRYLKLCESDLLGIAYVETRFDCGRVGDGGKSLGCHQIHADYHPLLKDSERKDFSFSAAWTLDRLIRYGWPKYRTFAIKSHNGSSAAAAAYAVNVKAWADAWGK